MDRNFSPTGRYLLLTTAVNLTIAVVCVWQLLPPLSVPATIAKAAQPARQVELPAGPDITLGQPQRLSIPRFELDLDVRPGNYSDTHGWTLDNVNAFYNTDTLPLNDYAGNTHIYGHNIWPVFKSLHTLELGDELIIASKEHIFSYKYKSTAQVSPGNKQLYRYRGDPIVTLQTCSGAWNQHRQLFQFTLQDVIPRSGS